MPTKKKPAVKRAARKPPAKKPVARKSLVKKKARKPSAKKLVALKMAERKPTGKSPVRKSVIKKHTVSMPAVPKLRGRPPKKRAYIDFKRITRMARIQCGYDEIAYTLDIPYTYLVNHPNFQEAYKKGFELGKKSLRRAQYIAAVVNKNPTMLIWLGKQNLGQTDNGKLQPGPGGIPSTLANEKSLDKLSIEDVEKLAELVKKAQGPVQ